MNQDLELKAHTQHGEGVAVEEIDAGLQLIESESGLSLWQAAKAHNRILFYGRNIVFFPEVRGVLISH